MRPDKLVHMANQIGSFFATQPGEQAVEQIADHLLKFWDPRMRAAIVEHLAAGGEGLTPQVRAAVERLRQPPAACGSEVNPPPAPARPPVP